MKNLENYGLVELNAVEMISIDGGFISTPIFACIYGISALRPNDVSLMVYDFMK